MTYSALARPSATFAFNRSIRTRSAVQTDVLPLSHKVMLITLICLLGFVYLVTVTHIDALGYEVNGATETASRLKAENDDLTLASARMQSLDRVDNYAMNSGLVSVTPQ